MVDFIFNNFTSDPAPGSDFFKIIIEKTVHKVMKTKKDIAVSVNLVDPERMRELNKQYRNKDESTDVLSFSASNKEQVVLPKDTMVQLGDIIICLSRAKQQAKEKKKTDEEEFALLTVHGMLHLLGYDHEKSKDEQKMFTLQEAILDTVLF